jgi:HEPN domain-containing protein
MKQTTNDWFMAAKDDLFAAKKLVTEDQLTNIVAFHCQQCIEKSFKAVIEEKGLFPLKSHDLIRLQLNANIQLTKSENILLAIINEVYIDARYPGDLGLLPMGKPTINEAETFISFTEQLFKRLKQAMNPKHNT